MATCRDVIMYAYRLSGMTTDLSAEEAQMGLDCLQSMYDAWVSGGMFGRLTDKYKTADYEAAEGERVIAPSGVSITFPTMLDDLEYGGYRAPRDLACIETIVDGVRSVKIWDRSAWVSLLDLEIVDTAPLSSRGLIGLAAALASSEAYLSLFAGAVLTPHVERLSSKFLGSLSGKQGTTQERAPALYY